MEPDPSARRVTLRRVRRGAEEERADAEFWLSLTGEQRVELLWDMVLDRFGKRGERAEDSPRLRRAVRRVRRP